MFYKIGCLLIFCLSLLSHEPKKDKLLVLIIASDNFTTYLELQKLWRLTMHLDPRVDAYFIKGDPKIQSTYKIEEDILWLKMQPTFIPGILEKTVMAFEAMLPNLENYDYVLRTNLSSFYIFHRLFDFLETLPTEGCYCAVPGMVNNIPFGSGAGFILSPDLIQLIVNKKDTISYNLIDDVAIGEFLYHENIPIIPATRFDFHSPKDWEQKRDLIGDDVYHIRINNGISDANRLKHDIPMRKEVINRFYP